MKFVELLSNNGGQFADRFAARSSTLEGVARSIRFAWRWESSITCVRRVPLKITERSNDSMAGSAICSIRHALRQQRNWTLMSFKKTHNQQIRRRALNHKITSSDIKIGHAKKLELFKKRVCTQSGPNIKITSLPSEDPGTHQYRINHYTTYSHHPCLE